MVDVWDMSNEKGVFFGGGWGVGLLDCGAFLFEVSRKDGDQGRRR